MYDGVSGGSLVRELIRTRFPRRDGLLAAVPEPLEPGEPTEIHPRHWTVVRRFGGDPRLLALWQEVLDARGRARFRRELDEFGDAAWVRARGWALEFAVSALPYYRDTNPLRAGNARHTYGWIGKRPLRHRQWRPARRWSTTARWSTVRRGSSSSGVVRVRNTKRSTSTSASIPSGSA
ncbi:hypothetical protein SAMN05216188_12458 [Lentzea xinjiangensis]|uniref:Uncharacterized protein n=1 Tax=Lentzea xinjiangensis TaxID=402600 RepID=A0A1H9V6V4_9PSEU|nr:hypothetical protein SAMN05216188_12458 [Lentzea xinjiangensis]